MVRLVARIRRGSRSGDRRGSWVRCRRGGSDGCWSRSGRRVRSRRRSRHGRRRGSRSRVRRGRWGLNGGRSRSGRRVRCRCGSRDRCRGRCSHRCRSWGRSGIRGRGRSGDGGRRRGRSWVGSRRGSSDRCRGRSGRGVRSRRQSSDGCRRGSRSGVRGRGRGSFDRLNHFAAGHLNFAAPALGRVSRSNIVDRLAVDVETGDTPRKTHGDGQGVASRVRLAERRRRARLDDHGRLALEITAAVTISIVVADGIVGGRAGALARCQARLGARASVCIAAVVGNVQANVVAVRIRVAVHGDVRCERDHVASVAGDRRRIVDGDLDVLRCALRFVAHAGGLQRGRQTVVACAGRCGRSAGLVRRVLASNGLAEQAGEKEKAFELRREPLHVFVVV